MLICFHTDIPSKKEYKRNNKQNIERKEVSKKKITNDGGKETAKKQPKKVEKIGRNDPCPCGSGKKYKQCCGK